MGNLAANSACTLAVRLEGIDLVFAGAATRVTEQPTLETVARLYRESGWPAEVAGDSFTAPYSAPSAGPPPWVLGVPCWNGHAARPCDEFGCYRPDDLIDTYLAREIVPFREEHYGT